MNDFLHSSCCRCLFLNLNSIFYLSKFSLLFADFGAKLNNRFFYLTVHFISIYETTRVVFDDFCKNWNSEFESPKSQFESPKSQFENPKVSSKVRKISSKVRKISAKVRKVSSKVWSISVCHKYIQILISLLLIPTEFWSPDVTNTTLSV